MTLNDNLFSDGRFSVNTALTPEELELLLNFINSQDRMEIYKILDSSSDEDCFYTVISERT